MTRGSLYLLSAAVLAFLVLVAVLVLVGGAPGRTPIPLTDGFVAVRATSLEDRLALPEPAEALRGRPPSGSQDDPARVDYGRVAAWFDEHGTTNFAPGPSASSFTLSGVAPTSTIHPAPLEVTTVDDTGVEATRPATFQRVRIDAQVRLPVNRTSDPRRVTAALLGCYAERGARPRAGVFVSVGPVPEIGRVDVFVGGDRYETVDRTTTAALQAGWNDIVVVCQRGRQRIDVWINDRKVVKYAERGDDGIRWRGDLQPVLGLLADSVEDHTVGFRDIEIWDLS